MSDPFGTTRIIVNPILDECEFPATVAKCIIVEAIVTDSDAKFYEALNQGDRMLGRCAKTGHYCLGPVLYAEVMAILEQAGIRTEYVSLGEMN